MIRTEEQAKALWCPMVRVSNVGQTYNRVDPAYLSFKAGADREYFDRQAENCNCIAGKCAMWQFETEFPRRRVINASVFNMNAAAAGNYEYQSSEEMEGEPAAWVETVESASSRATGYCGLSMNRGVAA